MRANEFSKALADKTNPGVLSLQLNASTDLTFRPFSLLTNGNNQSQKLL